MSRYVNRLKCSFAMTDSNTFMLRMKNVNACWPLSSSISYKNCCYAIKKGNDFTSDVNAAIMSCAFNCYRMSCTCRSCSLISILFLLLLLQLWLLVMLSTFSLRLSLTITSAICSLRRFFCAPSQFFYSIARHKLRIVFRA